MFRVEETRVQSYGGVGVLGSLKARVIFGEQVIGWHDNVARLMVALLRTQHCNEIENHFQGPPRLTLLLVSPPSPLLPPPPPPHRKFLLLSSCKQNVGSLRKRWFYFNRRTHIILF